MRPCFIVSVILLCLSSQFVDAAPVTSRCLAVAQAAPGITPVAYRQAALSDSELRLTFVGHSTFLIETASGLRIATDYAGYAGRGVVPDVVTMNHAHETHYTDYPDPKIKHVLRGWNPEGGHAEHNLEVGGAYIRSVPTNIRVWDSTETEAFGNSIFIIEAAGLCIGHLGHLQHELTPQQLGQIGQLDVVLVPADGVWTMDHAGMAKVVKSLHPRLIVPMHYFDSGTLGIFLDKLRPDYDIQVSETASVVLSQAQLPKKPQVLVLPGY